MEEMFREGYRGVMGVADQYFFTFTELFFRALPCEPFGFIEREQTFSLFGAREPYI